jgi:capsular exopolysaccharide synthesis family protein
MSEIFSWLKRAELEKRKSMVEAAPKPVPAYSGIHEETATAVEPAPALPDLAPGGIKIRMDAQFDLAAADGRIRSVLDPLTLVGEQYRLLRAKLSLMQKERGIRSLLVTSSVPAEGKTFTACCLAGVFAQEPGKRVLLMDADLRKPRAGRDLGVKDSTHQVGLLEVLRGEKKAEEVLLSSSRMDFFLLPGGSVPDDPAELLSSPNLEHTIRSLTEMFDWVIIDAPPIIGLADTSLIAPLCDAVLLVVHTDKTPAKLAKEAVERIGRAKFCGVVMNRGKHVRASRYYYYNYYHRKGQGRRA